MSKHTFDTLSRMLVGELEALYRASNEPTDLSVLGSSPNGRMLAIHGLDRGLLAAGLRALARQRHFVWVGKKLVSGQDGKHGHGANRVRFGREWFPFTTRIGKSIIDGRDTFVFEYDHPGNSQLGRKPYDELREVSPGIFLGPVFGKTSKGKYVKILWFALDAKTA
ncbi:hypothetical protein [Mycobacterium sp. NPDC050853]|uniref:hypothetical protein n=1 Tax=Mycobacterium sp. NPDC050853 TaxID=3155160 RepID=UPI00340E976A